MPAALPYLQQPERTLFNIQLEASLQPKGGDKTVTTHTNFQQLYDPATCLVVSVVSA